MEVFNEDLDLNAMIDINFKFLTMKLLHAKWISEGHNHMRLAAENKICVKAWKSSGIQYAERESKANLDFLDGIDRNREVNTGSDNGRETPNKPINKKFITYDVYDEDGQDYSIWGE